MIKEGNIPAVHVGASVLDMTLSVDWPPWILKGGNACETASPDLFFPPSYGSRFYKQIARAKALCSDCPLRAECLDWATTRPSVHGIWGGTTPTERRKMRVEAAAADDGTAVA